MEAKQRIVLIMAMEAEAEPLIRQMKLAHQGALKPGLPMQHYTTELPNSDLSLVLCGQSARYGVDLVGTQPATLTAYLAGELTPDLVVNAGTCGAFGGRGSRIGDVYLGSEFLYHDRRISLPGFHDYGIGHYLGGSFVPSLAETLNCKTAIVTTGNSLDISPTDMEMMQKTNGLVAKEMEAASIAWVMELLGIPFIALKSVTDLVDNTTPPEKEFIENLGLASTRLKDKLLQLFEWLDQHTLAHPIFQISDEQS